MRNYDENLNNKIKISLQQAYDILKKDKEPEKKYELFDELACQYLAKGVIRDYPKVVAIYQYMMKLQPDRGAELEGKIASVEEKFISKANGPGHSGLEKVTEYKKRLEEFRGVENSEQYGKSIRARLKGIEDLGIVEGQEELDEEGLQKRAKEVEKIYMGIREFFIGEGGLIKDLISDCIKDLGGLPVIDKNGEKREVEYAIFGMGSMALGTMTPWSDMEFGILIEEGLSQTEEKVVKEYFRNLTSLLHIRVINFGETPLRMMGIEELNNFKSGKSEDDWFFDELINSGFSFDGPHAHACKTPLGRQGFKGHQDFELIQIPCKLAKMQNDNRFKSDSHLLQGLVHIAPIFGNNNLLAKYSEELMRYKKLNQQRALAILREDCHSFEPRFNENIHDGALFDVKKEIYRLSDRVVVALTDLYKSKADIIWNLLRKLYEDERIVSDAEDTQNLIAAVGIACELRLRTYSNNNGQIENLSYLKVDSIIEYEQRIKEVFQVNHVPILNRYFFTILPLYDLLQKFIKFLNVEGEWNLVLNNSELYNESQINKALIYKRLLQYEKSQDLLELYLNENERRPQYLVILGDVLLHVGKYEEARKNYEEALKVYIEELGEDHDSVANVLRKIGDSWSPIENIINAKNEFAGHLKQKINECMNDFQEENTFQFLKAASKYVSANTHKALEFYNKALNAKNPNQVTRMWILQGLADVYSDLKQYEKSRTLQMQCLDLAQEVFGNKHPNYAGVLASLVANLGKQMEDSEVESCFKEALKIYISRYNNNHPYVGALYLNFGYYDWIWNRHEKAYKYISNAISIYSASFGVNHPNLLTCYFNIGRMLMGDKRYFDAVPYLFKAMQIIKHNFSVDPLVDYEKEFEFLINLLGEAHFHEKEYLKALQYYNTSFQQSYSVLDTCEFLLKNLSEQMEHVSGLIEIAQDHKLLLENIVSDMDPDDKNYKKYSEDYFKKIESAKKNISDQQSILLKIDEDHRSQTSWVLNEVRGLNHSINYGNLLEIEGDLNTASSIYQRSMGVAELCYGNNEKLTQWIREHYTRVQRKIELQKIGVTPTEENLEDWVKNYTIIAKLKPVTRSTNHNLGCYCHVMALNAKNQGKKSDYFKYMEKLDSAFESELNLFQNEPRASIYSEYSQFLIRYHDKLDGVEYKKIVGLLEKAIKQGNDGSGLGYGKIERETVIAPLQEVIDEKGQIDVKPYFLACYLLCKVHLIHSNYHRARGALAEFSKIEEKTDVCEKLYKSAKQEVAATMIQKSWREYIKKRENEVSVAGQTIH